VLYADGSSETLHQNPAIWKESPRTATITLPGTITGTGEVQGVSLDGGIFMEASQANNVWPSIPAVDPRAPVVAQVANADGTASISMTLPAKSQSLAPTQFSTPLGVVVVLTVNPPTTTATDAIKTSAAAVNINTDDVPIAAGESIAGYPSEVLRTTANLGGVTYGYDSYAFTTSAATYQILLLLPNAAAVDAYREEIYPDLMQTVAVAPKE
jgi:hypothetical protein